MARGDREEVGGFLVFVSASELFSASSFDVPCPVCVYENKGEGSI
jgi:hypothetical protein